MYLNYFFVYSILGYLLETVVALLTKSGYKSGFLYGFWTPVYGIGAVVILVLSHYFFMNLHMPRWKETIIVFIVLAIFLSCLELIGGLIIEKIFHVTFWNYCNMKYHIGKYICLEMLLIWGILSIILIYLVNPLLDKFIKKIPLSITIILSILMIIDIICTIIFKYKK